LNNKRKIWRRVWSDRGTAYLEYATVAAVVLFIATAAFTPGSPVNEALGCDFALREVLIKLPIF